MKKKHTNSDKNNWRKVSMIEIKVINIIWDTHQKKKKITVYIDTLTHYNRVRHLREVKTKVSI